METDLIEQAKRTIRDCVYMNIATVKPDHSAWNTPVYYIFDSKYNLYWYSDKNSVHSQNILKNPHVFISIYSPDETSPGVYMEAEVIELSQSEEFTNLTMRDGTPFTSTDFLHDSPLRIYKAVLKKVSISTPETAEKYKDWWIDKRVDIKLNNN